MNTCTWFSSKQYILFTPANTFTVFSILYLLTTTNLANYIYLIPVYKYRVGFKRKKKIVHGKAPSSNNIIK